MEVYSAFHEVFSAKLLDDVQEYYGKKLSSSADLMAPSGASDLLVTLALKNVNDEVKDRFYGCGSPLPPCLDGLKVLDVGCRSGRDC